MRICKRLIAMVLTIAMVTTLFAGLALPANAADTVTIAAWDTQAFAANTNVTANTAASDNASAYVMSEVAIATNNGSGLFYATWKSGNSIYISGLNTANYTDVALSVQLRGSQKGTFTISTSADGTTYSELTTQKITSSLVEYTISGIPQGTVSIKMTYGSAGSLFFVKPTLTGISSDTPVTKYTVTVENGTGGTISADKTEAAAGETVTLTATPKTGYELSSWVVTTASEEEISVTNNQFTMPAENVTVGAKFDVINCNVAFIDNGNPGTSHGTSVIYGSWVDKPDDPDAPEGYVFVGWSTSEISTPQNNAPALYDFNTTAVYTDLYLYAVYAKANEGGFKLYTSGGLDGNYYVGTQKDTNSYLSVCTQEADAAEFGMEAADAEGYYYLYYITDSGKMYVYNEGTNGLNFSDTQSDAKSWKVTENGSTLTFQCSPYYLTFTGGSVTARTFSPTYVNMQEFTKIAGSSFAGYTTSPGYTITWMNGTVPFKTESLLKDSEVTPPAEDPTKENIGSESFVFVGWSDKAEGGTVLTTFPPATADATYYAVFQAKEIVYTAELSLAASVRVGRTATASAKLLCDGVESSYDQMAYTSSNETVATIDADGKITALTVGTTEITVTYTIDGKTVTATQTLTVVENTSSGGYTLITKDNFPTDWSGDYIIMGKTAGDAAHANEWMILTPNYDSGSAAIVTDRNNAAFVSITDDVTVTDDGTIVGNGTIEDDGNVTSDVDKNIVMEDTGLVTDTNKNDILVYDTITSIDSAYAFTIECIDDVNQIYTIRVKDTSLYIACSTSTQAQDNSLNFSATATEYAQWQFSVERVEKGGYYNDIITAQNVGNENRRLYYNSNQYAVQSGQFRDYQKTAYSMNIGGDATGTGQAYNLYFFGNPNPFKAQIYYQGEQITIVNAAKIPQGRESIALQSALYPSIDDYPNWTQVDGPTWSIAEQSTGAAMTIGEDGVLATNGAASGAYALVTVTYQVRNEQTQVVSNVSTTAKVEIAGTDVTYSTVIYEKASEAEVQYTTVTGTDWLELGAYVVNDLNGDNSKDGTVVFGGTLEWTAESVNGNDVSIGEDGRLNLEGVTTDDIIVVTLTGATGDGTAASVATYKVYVKNVAYTVQITHDNGQTGDFSVPVGVTSVELDKLVKNNLGETPDAGTFSVNGGTWSIDGEQAHGASIDENGRLDLTACDRSEAFTLQVQVANMTATTISTDDSGSVTTTLPAATVTITVQALKVELKDDTVVLDYDRSVTFDVLANDDLSGLTVTAITTTALPEGVVNNNNGTFTYTPNDWIPEEISFTYTVTLSNGDIFSATVKIIPAESVYYEDSNEGAFTFTNGKRGEWEIVVDETVGAAVSEQTSSLASDDIFEFDSNYANCATFSAGSVHKVTVSAENDFEYDSLNPYVTFQFYGTGFDVFSLTSNNTGVFKVTYDGTVKVVQTYYGYKYSEEAREYTEFASYDRYKLEDGSYIKWDGTGDATGYDYIARATDPVTYLKVDTFYDAEGMEDTNGTYVKNVRTTHWVPSNTTADANDLYQIPVLSISGLEYGEHDVKIEAVYSKGFDILQDGSYDFYFDAVRVHNPTNATPAHSYISIRDELIEDGAFGDGSATPCDHADVGDWELYAKATNTTGGKGTFAKLCRKCGAVVEKDYFTVIATAGAVALDTLSESGLPTGTTLDYEITSENVEIQAILAALKDAQKFDEYWRSRNEEVFTCTHFTNDVRANGAGTTYATLQLSVGTGDDRIVYASAIHTPDITVTGHTHVFEPTNTVEATCLTEGSVTYTCSICKSSYTETLPTIDHTYGTGYESDETGHWQVCEICGWEEKAEHSFEDVVTPPTEETGGYTTHTCTVCGYSYTDSETPALKSYTVTYYVDGEVVLSETAVEGTAYTLADAQAATDKKFDYTFVGWITQPMSASSSVAPVVNLAGSSYVVSEDTAFYGVYSYSTTNTEEYALVEKAPADWSGSYVIVTNKADMALTPVLTSSGEFEATAVTIADKKVSSPAADIVWTFTPAGEGAYYIGNSNGYLKITGTDSKNAALTNAPEDSFTIESSGSDAYRIVSTTNVTRCFSYYDDGSSFRTYAKSNHTTGCLYKAVDGKIYTTDLLEPGEGSFTATFVTPGGVDTPAALTGDTVILPSVTGAPTENASATFLGWTTSPVTSTTSAPAYVAAGEEVTLYTDTTYYALYSYSEVSTGTGAGNYVKVTSAPSDWSGDYLIVYEDESFIFNGSLTVLDATNNYQSVTITDNTISAAEGDPYKFTIAATSTADAYSIQSTSGYYIGATNDKNSLESKTSIVYTNTLSLNADGTANVVGSGGAYLRFNTNSGQDRFRYFTAKTYGNQKAIALYAKEDGSGTPQYTTYYTTYDAAAAVSANAAAPAAVSVNAVAPAARTATRATETEATYSGAVFMDVVGNSSSVADMEKYGPDNEVYLSSGQAIVFYLVGDNVVEHLQIGAKAVNGTANLQVTSLNSPDAVVLNQPIATATEMYYEFGTTDLGSVNWTGTTSAVIVVQNTGTGVLSITNLRYLTEAGHLEFYVNKAAVDSAARLLKTGSSIEAPIIPAEPDPEAPADDALDTSLGFVKVGLNIKSELSASFVVDSAVLEGYDSWYVEFRCMKETGEVVETATAQTCGSFEAFTHPIPAKEMADTLYATLYAVKDGNTYHSATLEWSVQQEIANRLAAIDDYAANQKLVALYAAILNYGAAAQANFGYNAEHPANAILTDAEYACLAETAPAASVYAITSNGLNGVVVERPALGLKGTMQVQLLTHLNGYAAADVECHVVDAEDGSEIAVIDGAGFVEAGGYTVVCFDQFAAKDIRHPVTFTFYDKTTGKAISETVTYSIESYIAENIGAVSGQVKADLFEAIMAYGDAAKAYFG